MKIAALFPGQGSQAIGMGSDFVAEHEICRELFYQADKVLGYELSKICSDGPIEELTLTQNAQPALLTVGFAAFKAWNGLPSTAAGHSLGEYTALVAAESLAFTDAISLVHQRGVYMQEAVEPGKGKMLAVLSLEEEKLREIMSEVSEGVVEIANLNCPGQIVVAGDSAAIDELAIKLADKSVKAMPLNVSAPFHCSLMEPAAEKLAKDLDATAFKDPCFPVYSNVTAGLIESGDDARELLKQQVCASVRWSDLMLNMTSQNETEAVVEFGPGGVLARLMKRINPGIKRYQVFDQKSLEHVWEEVGTGLSLSRVANF